jgi:hypothetical protein
MSTKTILECAYIAGLVLSVAVIASMLRTKIFSSFPSLCWLIVTHTFGDLIAVLLLYFRKPLGIPISVAYPVYIYSRWAGFFISAIILIAVIYHLYQKIMSPFEGLQKVGSVVFRWVAIVSVVLSLGLALGPHTEGVAYFRMLSERIEQGSSVLTLCLLLFVCAAARPLGLTYRDRVFGVTLGLGVVATSTLVEGAWMASRAITSVYSPIYLISSCSFVLACGIWGWYFVMPEPAARMVLLPTTSPFFLWNRVSEALGDEPGYVAVAGFRPEMLEPVELKVLTAASIASRDRRSREAAAQAAERERTALAQASLQQSGTHHTVAIQR